MDQPAGTRLDTRYQKFRAMGRLGQAFTDEGPIEAPSSAEQSE